MHFLGFPWHSEHFSIAGGNDTVEKCYSHDSSMPRDGYLSQGLAMLMSRDAMASEAAALTPCARGRKRRVWSACQSGCNMEKHGKSILAAKRREIFIIALNIYWAINEKDGKLQTDLRPRLYLRFFTGSSALAIVLREVFQLGSIRIYFIAKPSQAARKKSQV